MDALTRQKSLMAAAGAVVAMLGLVGCEKLQSSSVEADRTAVAAMAKGQLDVAAGEKGASPEIRTTVHSQLSTQHYGEGVEAYTKAMDARLDASRLAWQATRLASMASQNLDSARGLDQYDPAASRLKADEAIGSIRGASDKMTRTVAGVEMPTLTAVDANIEKLNADIGAVQKQVEELTANQQQLSQKAQQAEAHAKDLKGQAAVDAYKQAADATRQASDAAVKIELAQAKLVPLQQDLAVAQEQKTALTASVAEMDSLKAKLNEGWAGIDAQKAPRTKIAEALIGKSPERDRLNLVATVKDLELVGRDGEKVLGQSETAFKAAVDNAHEASAASSQAAKRAADLLPGYKGTSQEIVFRDVSQKTFNPNSQKVTEAMGEFALSRVYADQAGMLKTREGALTQLASAAGRVNYSVPADLPKAGQIAADRKEADAKAAASLKKTDETLSALDQLLPSGGDIKQTVAVGRMMTLLSASEVAGDMGNSALANSYLDDAKAIFGAMPADAKLPELPAPLQVVRPATPAPAPAAQPEAPASAPAVQPEAPAPVAPAPAPAQ